MPVEVGGTYGGRAPIQENSRSGRPVAPEAGLAGSRDGQPAETSMVATARQKGSPTSQRPLATEKASSSLSLSSDDQSEREDASNLVDGKSTQWRNHGAEEEKGLMHK